MTTTFEQIVLASYTDGEFELPEVIMGKEPDYRDASVTVKRKLGDAAVTELLAADGTVTTSIDNGELSLSVFSNGDRLILSKDETGPHAKGITAQGLITEL